MSTVIRPEVSRKNPYYISRHRYFELKHFCLQYPEWRKKYLYLRDQDSVGVPNIGQLPNPHKHSDRTGKIALERAYYRSCMELVESTAEDADYEIGGYIFKAVTEGRSYDYLKTMLSMPCGRDMYYNRYRKFFWLLDQTRN